MSVTLHEHRSHPKSALFERNVITLLEWPRSTNINRTSHNVALFAHILSVRWSTLTVNCQPVHSSQTSQTKLFRRLLVWQLDSAFPLRLQEIRSSFPSPDIEHSHVLCAFVTPLMGYSPKTGHDRYIERHFLFIIGPFNHNGKHTHHPF